MQLTDRSSYRSCLVDALGCAFGALHETTILTGAGRISLGTSASAADAALIGYQIRRP
jgi:hypothetical protein